MATQNIIKPSLESLPTEILIEIFLYLYDDDIEIAAKLCRRWHTIITETPKLAGKFCLEDLNFDSEKEQLEALEKCKERSQEFPFRNFHFDSVRWGESFISKKRVETIKNILKAHKNHVEKLRIECDVRPLVYLLKETGVNENLTKLSISFLYDPKGIEASDPKFDFPNLKHLVMNRSLEFISLIRSHKIEKLTTEASTKNFTDEEEIWKKFLSTCSNLKWLRMRDFFPFDVSNYDFKIEYFYLKYEYPHLFIVEKFLKSQKENLKFLSIDSCSYNIFNVINELKVQKFHVDEIYVYDEFKPNTSIKEIRIRIEARSESDLLLYKKIINSLTCVENLYLIVSYGNFFQLINFISVSMPRLKTLTLSVLPPDRYASKAVIDLNSKIQQVESLTIKHLSPYDYEDKEALNNVLTCCPNIKKFVLELDRPEMIKADELRTIFSLSNIEEISINDDISKSIEEVLDTLLSSKIRKISFSSVHTDWLTENWEIGFKYWKIPEKLKNSNIQIVGTTDDLDDEEDDIEGFWQ